MEKPRELVLNYRANGFNTTATYEVSEQTWLRAQSLRDENNDRAVADWLLDHGDTLHCANGPALVMSKDDGSVTKKYYEHGELHRVDGPAIDAYDASGTTSKEYYTRGKRDRVGGPAISVRYKDGSGFDKYCTDGKVVKVRIGSPSTAPDATARRAMNPLNAHP
jgi:hypothetical protein